MFTIFNTYKLNSDFNILKNFYILRYVLGLLYRILLLPWHLSNPLKALPSEKAVRFLPDKLPQREGNIEGTKKLISFIKV